MKMKITKKVKAQFKEILSKKKLYPVYQPIVSLKDGSICGYEALTRIDLEEPLINIEELFILANELKCAWKLESICRKMALKQAAGKVKEEKIFLNVSPCVMQDSHFKAGTTAKYLEKYQLNPENIVFEITERHSIENEKAFLETIRHYTDSDYKIAVDDYGTEHAGIQRVCTLKPHFIKIDMSIVRDFHKDYLKRMMIKSMVMFCKNAGILLIAEGVETKEELEALIDMEVDYGQGYYFAKPNREILPLQDEVISKIQELNVRHDENKDFHLFQYIQTHKETEQLTVTNEKGEIVAKLSCENMREILGV